jgi:hypothetical protein
MEIPKFGIEVTCASGSRAGNRKSFSTWMDDPLTQTPRVPAKAMREALRACEFFL